MNWLINFLLSYLKSWTDRGFKEWNHCAAEPFRVPGKARQRSSLALVAIAIWAL